MKICTGVPNCGSIKHMGIYGIPEAHAVMMVMIGTLRFQRTPYGNKDNRTKKEIGCLLFYTSIIALDFQSLFQIFEEHTFLCMVLCDQVRINAGKLPYSAKF